MTTKGNRSVSLDKEVLRRIDDFRFENRIGSFSEALQKLIERGLEQTEQKPSNRAPPEGGKTAIDRFIELRTEFPRWVERQERILNGCKDCAAARFTADICDRVNGHQLLQDGTSKLDDDPNPLDMLKNLGS